MDHKHSYRDFGMDKTGIRLSTIKSYLGGCSAATKDGMNCNSSLIYTADGKTLDCTEYCRENCRKWVPNMFKRQNIPSGAIVTSEDLANFDVDIKKTSIMLYTYNEKEDTGTALEIYIYPNGNIKDANTEEDLKENKASELVCDFILNKFKKGNFNNLTITSYLNKKNLIIYEEDYYKFVSFKNNLKIFKPSKYWKLKKMFGFNIELRIEFQV